MKFIPVFLISLILSFSATAKDKSSPYVNADGSYRLNVSDTKSHTGIVEYVPDASGMWINVAGEEITDEVVVLPSEIYAFCPKNAMIFYAKENGNFCATVIDDFLKLLKKDKSLPVLKIEETDRPVAAKNKAIEQMASNWNSKRRAFVLDSLENVRIQQQRADSIRKLQERNDRLRVYRENNASDWRCLPLKGSLFCDVCNATHKDDHIVLSALDDDAWAYLRPDDTDNPPGIMHLSVIPVKKKLGDELAWHLEAFADSLDNMKSNSASSDLLQLASVKRLNDKVYEDALSAIRQQMREKCPYGLVNEWGWDNEYGNVSFYVTFTNYNSKTIKYIDYYFSIFNDVGDKRGSGNFKGTGPVEPWYSGSWEWETSRYWTYGDASKMKITKIIITYMNGTTKTLTGSALVILD